MLEFLLGGYPPGRDETASAFHAAVERRFEVKDQELAALFLGICAQTAYHLGRDEDLRILSAEALEAVPRNALPEVRAFLCRIGALQMLERGNVAGFEAALGKAIELLPETSPQYHNHLFNYGLCLAQQGRAAEIGPRLHPYRVGEYSGDGAADRLAVIDLFNAMETGRFGEALTLVPRLEAAGGLLRPKIERTRRLLTMAVERWCLPALPSAPRNPSGAVPLWAASIEHLLAGRPSQALLLARREADADLEVMLNECDILSFNLLRAELACGNSDSARHLLELRRRRGNRHFLDDLFVARADMLDGRRGRAAQGMATVARACRRLGAAMRLDFELRAACELKIADVLSAFADQGVEVVEREPASQAAGDGIAIGAETRGTARLAGRSPQIAAIRDSIKQVAGLDVPVLITGETGTGKELVAKAIHECGTRAMHPFIAVNCGAISESLLESELFGHSKGAFSGADRNRRGVFEEAGSGTLFLDEIGDVSPRLQSALLRVLEDGNMRPVGSSRERKSRCRVLAATNSNLEHAVARGSFRKDLYYRLRRLEIHLPPLRERSGDAAYLFEHFLAAGRADGRSPRLSSGLRQMMNSYSWPGNVRELRNDAERVAILNSDKDRYDLEDWSPAEPSPRLEPLGPASLQGTPQMPAPKQPPFRRRDTLRDLFAQHGKMNLTEAARLLGVSRPTVGKDLRVLIDEGLVEKVMPNRSPRSHYFRLKDGQ